MTIQIDSFFDSGYQAASTGFSLEHTMSGVSLPFPGLAVGVSIFGSGTVTSIQTGSIDTSQSLIFIRADTNGSYRSELWYLPNLVVLNGGNPFDVFFVDVAFSASVPAVCGSIVYKYFGGVGAHGGDTGTSTPLASINITPTQPESILFSNFCINAVGGGGSSGGQYDRWEASGGSNNHGLGADRGPFPTTAIQDVSWQTAASPVWSLSAVELLTYQDTPPGIMGP